MPAVEALLLKQLRPEAPAVEEAPAAETSEENKEG